MCYDGSNYFLGDILWRQPVGEQRGLSATVVMMVLNSGFASSWMLGLLFSVFHYTCNHHDRNS
jgi:hypothetical protein